MRLTKRAAVTAVGALTVTFVASGCGGDSTLTQAERIDKVKPTVVRIEGKNLSGSGVVIDAQRGLVLSNAHVTVGNPGMKAVVGDDESTETAVRTVASAPCEDLAVVRLVNKPSNLAAIKFGDSQQIKSGEHVSVFGYPGSLEEDKRTGAAGQASKLNTTEGTVSSANVAATPDPALPRFASVIQHQAPVNHGDSGGPLINDAGELVGINTLLNPEAQGQYYAISADRVKASLPELTAGKSQAFVGWDVQPLNDVNLAAVFKEDSRWGDETDGQAAQNVAEENDIEGLFVWGVETGSPAHRARIRWGDLIQAVEGQPVTKVQDVCDVLNSKNPGEKVRVDGRYVNSANSFEQILEPWSVNLRVK